MSRGLRLLALTLAFAFCVASPDEARASAWMGCEGCTSLASSPMCSSCTTPAAPTVPTWGMPQLPYCPQCMANAAAQFHTMPPMNQWWMGYQPNYYNFFMPGPYNGMGMMPQYFPQPPFQPQGGGGVYMAKPVLYLRGPKGTKVEIGVTPAKGELIVAVPALRQWKAEIRGPRLKTAEGEYEFFFYDLWMDHAGLQDEKGACGDRKETLAYLETALRQRGFPEEAVQDFNATWSVKLPHQQELCVFPQSEEQLQGGLTLTFKPATVQLTQLEFVVVPKRFFGSAEAKTWNKFTKEPRGEYAFRKPASSGNPATADGAKAIRAFDWGVGFLRMEK